MKPTSFFTPIFIIPDSNDTRYNSIIEKYQKDSNSVCLDEIQFLGDYYPKKLKNDSKFLKCCHVYYIWFLSLSLFKDFYAKTLNDVIFNLDGMLLQPLYLLLVDYQYYTL